LRARLRPAGLRRGKPGTIELAESGVKFGRAAAHKAGICLALLFDLRHFVGNFVANFVENLAEFDGVFSNINRVDEVPDEVSDEGTKG